ncbi:hypothetical protein ACIA5H_28090 [Nocardia sp. NPDC051900]|uniref:hypothetical protein n=1 Tax=Nocardia sp. NPDC051900 TaxID=3364326 RepID=UPI0037ABFC00
MIVTFVEWPPTNALLPNRPLRRTIDINPAPDPMRAEARTEAGHASAAQQDAKQPALLD